MEEMEVTPLPDDIVREILQRVSADEVATLFRCAVTCKQWRAFVADLSFLRHHWPENAPHPSSLLGFFDKRYDDGQPPFFSPVSPGSKLSYRRRSLTSFVRGAPDGILDDAVPLAAQGGLLLVHLTNGRLDRDSLHLALCDILTGTCNVLPSLECGVSKCGCAILAREEWCSLEVQQGRRTPSTGYSAVFNVLAMVIDTDDEDCNLYTISSSEPNWREPRKCFHEVWQHDTFGLRILIGTNMAIVCRGVAYWLGSYLKYPWSLVHYFTFGVNVKTDQISFTELSIQAIQLTSIIYSGLMLSVDVDGKLSLLHLQNECLRLNTWIREDDGTWLRTRVIELKPPEQVWDHMYVVMLSGEKSGLLFMADLSGSVHKIDPETWVMEDVTTDMFEDSLGIRVVPIEIDWPALFMSRLIE